MDFLISFVLALVALLILLQLTVLLLIIGIAILEE